MTLEFTVGSEDYTPLPWGQSTYLTSPPGVVTNSLLQLSSPLWPPSQAPESSFWSKSGHVSPLPLLECYEDSDKVPLLRKAHWALHDTTLPAFLVSFLITSPRTPWHRSPGLEGSQLAALARVIFLPKMPFPKVKSWISTFPSLSFKTYFGLSCGRPSCTEPLHPLWVLLW